MENHVLRAWMDSIEPFLAPLADVARSFTDLTGVPVDLPTALFLRAQLAGLERPGRTSANGSCHLLRTADGWAALNLARPDDLAAVPALLGLLGSPDEPGGLPTAVRRVTAAEVVRGAELLGIAAAVPGSAQGARPAVHAERWGEGSTPCDGGDTDRRLLRALGGTAVRTAAGAGRRAGREGGECDATRRRALRDARLLSLAARRARQPGRRFRPRCAG